MKRSPLRRGSKPLTRTRMKASRPSTRARPDCPLSAVCMVVTRVCTGAAEHRHHLAGRGKPGTAIGDALDRLTVDCCLMCHQYLHSHPTESYDMGWMLHRNARVLP